MRQPQLPLDTVASQCIRRIQTMLKVDDDWKPIQWKQVSDTFLDGFLCRTCQWKLTETEPHGERVRGCFLLDHKATSQPTSCPGTEEK